MKKSIHSTSDLARHLGLSRWAVSRAINGQDGVSAETVAQVRDAMREFGFVPSPHGRGLRGQRTGVIGISFRALDTPVTIRKIAEVQRLVSEQGYRPLFEIAGEADAGLAVMSHFVAMRVEGVLLVDAPPAAECKPWLALLRRNGIPAAFLEPRAELPSNAVQLDREKALARITDHLLALGHRDFGLLGISPNFPLGVPRFRGICGALERRGLDPARQVQIFELPGRHEGLGYGSQLADQLLAARRRPTALIALNDEVAAGALWRLERAALQVPRDLSLFGFDNLPLSGQVQPALSTVDHQVATTARIATELLFRLIEKGPTAKIPTTKIEPALIHRDSVGTRG